jgi:hypothetical protein
MNRFRFLRRAGALALLGLSALSASAQAPGHLNVPGLQTVHSHYQAMSGTRSNEHQWLGLVFPDGRVQPMQYDQLTKQTLTLMDVIILVYRPNGPTGADESGEIYLGDQDASQKGRPLQDQMPLVRYTIPGNESRVLLRVSLGAGRAFSGYRHPVLIHYGPYNAQIGVRTLGYVVPN